MRSDRRIIEQRGGRSGKEMRLDRYLWFVRLVKTRALARALAAEGRLRIDGRPCDKPHAEVRPGMVLAFALHDSVRILRIEALPARRGPAAEARACYSDLAPGPPTVDAGCCTAICAGAFPGASPQ